MIQAENLRVVDDTMTDVPADGNTMGEIVMRGNNVMAGYYRDLEPPPRRSAAAGFTAETSASCTPPDTSKCATTSEHRHLRRRKHCDHQCGAGPDVVAHQRIRRLSGREPQQYIAPHHRVVPRRGHDEF